MFLKKAIDDLRLLPNFARGAVHFANANCRFVTGGGVAPAIVNFFDTKLEDYYPSSLAGFNNCK